MANRLSRSTSPYLLQHADNPVDWWAWGEEAFARGTGARRPGPPVGRLRRVPLVPCHGARVVRGQRDGGPSQRPLRCVKVDREERPDVDAVYMQATQALTGQGGWPMSVFLTPDGDRSSPAPTSRAAQGMPSFRQVLAAATTPGPTGRDEVASRRRSSPSPRPAPIGQARQARRAPTPPRRPLPAEFDVNTAASAAHPSSRRRWSSRPCCASGVARRAAMGHDLRGDGPGRHLRPAGRRVRPVQRRPGWVVPHFEKMLYDNALLWASMPTVAATGYGWRTGSPGETADFLRGTADRRGRVRVRAGRRHARAAGGRVLRLDAGQLAEVLGAEDAGLGPRSYFGVTVEGTFEEGASVLQLPRTRASSTPRGRFIKARLLAARGGRPAPGRDDKVVAAWNGCGRRAGGGRRLFDRPIRDVALAAAELLVRVHLDGRAPSRGRGTAGRGDAGVPGGLRRPCTGECAAGRCPGRPTVAGSGPVAADGSAGSVRRRRRGVFRHRGGHAESLYTRPQDANDNATPSGLSAAVHALGLMAELTGDGSYADRAERAAQSVGGLARQAPRFAGWLLADAISRTAGRTPVQVAVVGDEDEARAALVREAYLRAPAGSVVVAGIPDQPGFALLADRPLVDGRATAYVCRGFVCRLPVTSVEALAEQLT